MELYRTGSILLDISLGFLIVGALSRLILAYIYYRRNGGVRNVTDRQRLTLRRVGMPFTILGIITGVASIIVLLI